MIILTAISFNGAAVSIPPTSFDELGGSIGRAATNQLVLPDADRSISRIHAQVVFRAGNYALIDRGSNAVLHNGRPVGNGREVILVVGDEIQIGGYRIAVSDGSTTRNDDPFADFDSESARIQESVIPIAPAESSAPAAKVEAKGSTSPLGLKPSIPTGHQSTTGIPDDWDPFRPDTPADQLGGDLGPGEVYAASAAKAAFSQPNPYIPELPVSVPSSEQSLDALFGLGVSAPLGDPLSGSSLTASQVQPNTSGDADPFRSLQQSPAAGVDTAHDHDSDLQAPWHDAPLSAKSPPPVVSELPGVVLSWDQPARKTRTMEPQQPAMPVALGAGAVRGDMEKASPPAAVLPGVSEKPQRTLDAPVGQHELMRAFLGGLGMPDLRVRPLSPDTMYQLGQLLRESTKGTVELLAARTALKKEVRAEVTVMGSTANNAMKFSPTVEFALQYLLGPQTAGFMGPVESMRDAFDDLRAHQLGVMAGMRAALSEVLKRFDPAVLEGKLAPRSTLASLIPSGRKAQLWELFQELFGQLVNEAEEDFDELFGKAFVREYERYVAQLNSQKH